MRNAIRIMVSGVIIVAASQAFASGNRSEEGSVQRRTSTDCFLHRVDDGSVWLGEPLISLGMIGVMADPPQYRLSDELARSLDALINRFVAGESRNLYCWGRIPRGRDAHDPTILVTLERGSRPITQDTQMKGELWDAGLPQGVSLYEIVWADIFQVEIIPRPWLEAWDNLNEALKEIVELSKTAPVPDKRKRLADVIDKGSEALGRMYNAVPPVETVRAVRAAVPKARVMRNFESRIEWEWGGHLRQYISALAIQPSKPLPPEPKTCTGMDRMKVLLESDSPAAFIAKMKQACPPEAMDEILTYSMLRAVVDGGRGRSSQPVYVWEVEQMTADEFNALREERKGYANRPAPVNVPTPEAEAEKAAATLWDKWGVCVRSADSGVLSKNLILQGMVVEDVAQTGSAIGLQPGDVIIDYDTTYDLRAGEMPFAWRIKRLAQQTRYPGKLRVLHEDEFVTIPLGGSR